MLQQGPVCQQWEQHRSQPAAEGDGGHAGGWRGQLLHWVQGRACSAAWLWKTEPWDDKVRD